MNQYLKIICSYCAREISNLEFKPFLKIFIASFELKYTAKIFRSNIFLFTAELYVHRLRDVIMRHWQRDICTYTVQFMPKLRISNVRIVRKLSRVSLR